MLRTTENGVSWSAWCEDLGVDDVYWSWDHLVLWAREWGAKPVGVLWKGTGGVIMHPVLLVPLDRLEGGRGFVDVRTAYDFGGPRLVRGEDPRGAMASFESDWLEWTRNARVVTEFLRLHPTALPVRPTSAAFQADHYIVDLTDPYEEIRARFRSSWRSRLRQGERGGSRVSMTEAPSLEEVQSFIRHYQDTMSRVGAAPWFRFHEETLAGLVALPKTWLATVWSPAGRAVAHAVFLGSGGTLFYHLSCSDPKHLELRPNHLLLDAAVRFGQQMGFTAFHLGGGSPSLAEFKAGMGGRTVPYHVVRKVVDPLAYGSLCAANEVNPDGSSFPAYVERIRS